MLRLIHSLFTCSLALSIVVVAIVATPVAAGSTNAANAHRTVGDAVRSTTIEEDFVEALNAERADHGQLPLVAYQPMTVAAVSWTQDMVDRSVLEHSSDITTGLPPQWLVAGENVGRGQSVDSLVEAFMNSPTHRANVLDERFTHVGVGVFVQAEGKIYTTHRFATLPNQQRIDAKQAAESERPKRRGGLLPGGLLPAPAAG